MNLSDPFRIVVMKSVATKVITPDKESDIVQDFELRGVMYTEDLLYKSKIQSNINLDSFSGPDLVNNGPDEYMSNSYSQSPLFPKSDAETLRSALRMCVIDRMSDSRIIEIVNTELVEMVMSI